MYASKVLDPPLCRFLRRCGWRAVVVVDSSGRLGCLHRQLPNDGVKRSGVVAFRCLRGLASEPRDERGLVSPKGSS
eukprot:12624786-Alexandrium_andersonii.AAC.1